MTRRLLTIFAVLALLGVGCGDDDDTIATEDPTVDDAGTDDVGADTGEDDETTSGAGTEVTIENFTFEPATVEVDGGAAVSWTNNDTVGHTATSGTPGEPDGTFDESLDSGESAEVVLDEAGTYPYFCAIHPDMTGEVVVS